MLQVVEMIHHERQWPVYPFIVNNMAVDEMVMHEPGPQQPKYLFNHSYILYI